MGPQNQLKLCNKYFSYNVGSLPKGCQLCITGEKTVLFVTGVCPRHCFYCPLSEQKKDKDVIYANEMPISDKDSNKLIEEAVSHNAKGAGITGGDPLARLNRTVFFIKALKKKFGKKFHIHLYTSLDLVDKKKLDALFKAGLDEIRFHPDLDQQKFLDRIALAKTYAWDVGIEIPMLPDKIKETKQLIEKTYENIDFLNLNELEYSDNGEDFSRYKTLSPETYAIKGSLQAGLKVIDFVKEFEDKRNSKTTKANKKTLSVHLCTAKLKDAVQLKNRIINKAKAAKLPFDKITEEGLLLRSCIYLKENSPRIRKLNDIRKDAKKMLPKLKTEIALAFMDVKLTNAEKKSVFIDEKNCRAIVALNTILKLKQNKKLDFAIVEEYPTFDGFITSVDFI